ncbi:hypothetical protein ACTJKO_16415 [Curtobacterium sp. 22159]|uniref:hypothetical protein n=1 Tax=Curtobacterium sp. 22159 TaxID=3453882 RepID=UPI003F84DE95
MSSTPLFDSIARRSERTPAASATVLPAAAPAPTSPLSAPVASADVVPAALVAAIDEIPGRVVAATAGVVRVDTEQLALVEAVADAITRAVVDAVAIELERITRDGVVRA